MPRLHFNSNSKIDVLVLGLMFVVVFAIGALTMQLVLVGIGCMNCMENTSSTLPTPLPESMANTRIKFLPDGTINFCLKTNEVLAVLLGAGMGSVLFFMTRTRDLRHRNFGNYPDVVPV